VPFLLLSLPFAETEQLAYYRRMGYQLVDAPPATNGADPGRRPLRKVVGGVWQRKETGTNCRASAGTDRA
jgi:hypothetical protein